MIKYILLLLSFNCFSSISLQNSQHILSRLLKANSMSAINIAVLNDNHVNAFGAPGYVAVTQGLLQYGNRNMIISILSHELGHVRGITSEVGADMASVDIARKAGLNVCPGAKQFLLTVGKVGGGTHPAGAIRLHRMGCK